jgi:hypothetical protein
MRFLALVLFLVAGPVSAECSGRNLLDVMDSATRNRIEAAAAAQPFHSGNLWQATRGDAHITLVGTYHLGDPRHDAMLRAVTPILDTATTLLVEAGPEEEAALMAQAARDPSVFIMPDTTLPALMDPAEWQVVAEAMSRRGIPGFMAAKFQPWYVSMLLAVPPCMMPTAAEKTGLDHQLIGAAQGRGLPIRALEPHDTVFRLFETFSRTEQIAMLRASLAIEGQAEDYLHTLADSYFAGNSWLSWELMREMSLALPGYTPEQIKADLARMEQALMIDRNAAWIPVILSAAAKGPLVAAFGALHLPGDSGVLALLQREGFTLTALPTP